MFLDTEVVGLGQTVDEGLTGRGDGNEETGVRGRAGLAGQKGGDGGRGKADRVEDETPSARRVCAVV